MKVEYLILIGVWLLGFAILFVIPRIQRRIALVAFLFKQLLTWLFGLIVVEQGWISYPERFFFEINRASFTFEYFAYPVLCGLFNAFYPNHHNRFVQLGYYGAYCTAITITEVILERFTNLIEYLNWEWYWTWFTLLATFYMTRVFCVWFFQGLQEDCK